MTETTTSPAAEAPVDTPKKGRGKAAAKKATPSKPKAAAKAKATHPPTSQMVDAAIKSLNEKGGSSLQAIKKYISANYKLEPSKANIFIRKYLKSAVTAGKLVQTKGTGANGSFRFPGKDKVKPAAATKGKKKPAAKKPAAKKAVTPKKVAPAKKASPKKKTVAKKAKPAKAAKSPAKPKPKKLKATAKPKKSPAKKPTKAAAASKKKAAPKRK